MTRNLIPGKTAALVHWTYSREEWNRFMKWKKMKKSLLHYILYWLRPAGSSKTPDIVISEEEVAMDDIHEPFHNGDRELRLVNIREAGQMNIMEITYETLTSKLPDFADICVLVPKGKLREAIKLQEELVSRHQPQAHAKML